MSRDQHIQLLKNVLKEFGHEQEMGLLPQVERLHSVSGKDAMILSYKHPDTVYTTTIKRGKLLNNIYTFLRQLNEIPAHKLNKQS